MLFAGSEPLFADRTAASRWKGTSDPCCAPCARGLDAAGDPITDCQKAFGLPYGQCAEIMALAQNDPNVYYAILRAAASGYGAKSCASYAQVQAGIPLSIGLPACKFAIDKVWNGLETYFTYGGPTVTFITHAPEGILWRRCSSPSHLRPGESWYGHTREKGICGLNIAIYKKDGEFRLARLSCADLKAIRTDAVCRDFDGVVRPMGTATRTYMAGFYSDWNLYPHHRNVTRPPTEALPSVMIPMKVMAPVYPSGAFTVYDPATSKFHVLVPTETP